MSTPMTTKFCSACANPLLATAVICPKCGSPAAGYNLGRPDGKSKTTAVLLAVFFGAWSWLYTYKVNAKKFWITTFVMFGVPIFMIFLALITSYSGSGRYVQGWMAALVALVWYGFLFGSWIWAIVDNAVKPESWYRSYSRN